MDCGECSSRFIFMVEHAGWRGGEPSVFCEESRIGAPVQAPTCKNLAYVILLAAVARPSLMVVSVHSNECMVLSVLYSLRYTHDDTDI